MPGNLKLGMHKRTASPRRLLLRLIMLDLSNGFFRNLADSFDGPPIETHKASATPRLELPLTETKQETTEGTTLDPASIRSLRSMFLLLDEWDHPSEERKSNNSSESYEISIDSKTN